MPTSSAHPGQVLLEDFLIPSGISLYSLAGDLGVALASLADLVHGRRRLEAEMALRLARHFNNSARYWLDLQERHDRSAGSGAVPPPRLGDRQPRPAAAAAR